MLFRNYHSRSIPTGIDGAYTYEDYAGGNQNILDPGERLMTPDEYILDQFGWHLLLEEEQRKFTRYWPEFLKLDGFNIVFSTSTVHHEPPDARWRVYLAMVLQRIQDKATRVKELENFFHYWQEMASK